jgi:hypothetical protein
MNRRDQDRLRGILAADRAARVLQWASLAGGVLAAFKYGLAALILAGALSAMFRLARPTLPPDLERQIYR